MDHAEIHKGMPRGEGHIIYTTWTLTQGHSNSNPDADSVVILQRTSSIPASEMGVKHHGGSNHHILKSGEFPVNAEC